MTIIRKIDFTDAPTVWKYIGDRYAFETSKLAALEIIAKWVAQGKEIGYSRSESGDTEEWIVD